MNDIVFRLYCMDVEGIKWFRENVTLIDFKLIEATLKLSILVYPFGLFDISNTT